MSDGNDREALEKRVAELEATVRGLTEELVDTTERIRQLEAEHGRHETAAERREARTDAGEASDAEATSESADDGAEAGKSQEAQSADEREESDRSDDIIVA